MGIPTRAEVRKRRQRGNYAWLAVALVAAAALAAMLTGFLVLYRDLDRANEARDALARQVQALGGTPVAGPPGSRGQPGETIVGQRGPAGPSGSPGKTGASGKPAPAITPSPGATGPVGPAGPSGAAGTPGADSTVPGSTGPAGQNGQDGASGSDGKNGAPPSQWSYVDQDGNEYQCTPVDNFDPDNPRYKCTQTSTAPASPDPSPSEQPQKPAPSDTESSLLPLGLMDRRTRSS